MSITGRAWPSLKKVEKVWSRLTLSYLGYELLICQRLGR